MKTIINAGHNLFDRGVNVAGQNEGDIVMKIRDHLMKMLPSAIFISDDLDTKKSIKFVNEVVDPEDLAIDIHANSNNSTSLRGVESYYDNEPDIAEIFAKCVSKASKIPNRGIRHDSESFYKSLGWLRKTECHSVLIETGYLSNIYDRRILLSEEGQYKIAQGIYLAIKEFEAKTNRIKAMQLTLVKLTSKVVRLLKLLIGLKYGK